jgi:hypothetical protein
VSCRLAVPCRMGSIRGDAPGNVADIAPHAANGMAGTGIGMGSMWHKVRCAECPDVEATTSAALYGLRPLWLRRDP